MVVLENSDEFLLLGLHEILPEPPAAVLRPKLAEPLPCFGSLTVCRGFSRVAIEVDACSSISNSLAIGARIGVESKCLAECMMTMPLGMSD